FDDPDGAKTRETAALDVRWDRNLTLVTAMTAHFYLDGTTERSRAHDFPIFGCVRDELALVPCLRTSNGFARSAGGELQWRFDWAGTRRHMTLLGGEGRVRQGGFENASTEVGTGTSGVY